ncbi:hypothetical protein C1T30_43525, partial [Bacillus sp. MBGLi97]
TTTTTQFSNDYRLIVKQIKLKTNTKITLLHHNQLTTSERHTTITLTQPKLAHRFTQRLQTLKQLTMQTNTML